MKALSLLLISVLALAGCKTIEIENGQIPAEYLETAKQFEGTYSGSFLGKSGSITLALNGDKPTLSYQDKDGNDLLGTNCNSQINNLMWIKGKEKNDTPVLQGAAFALDAGNCRLNVQGKEVVLAFSNQYQTIKVYVLEETRWERKCRWEPGNPPYNSGREVCEYNQAPIYLTGKFNKN
jgi:hypothetical protein